MEEKELHSFEATDTEETIKQTIDYWVRESTPYHKELLRGQEKSLKYYEGDQTDRDSIPLFRSSSVHNRIFEGTETLVPIVTGTAHQFVSLPGNDTEVSMKLASKVQKMLDLKYEELDMQGSLEQVARDMILKRFGVIEWFWDKENDDVGIRVLDPRTILIPKFSLNARELPYVIKILSMTPEDIDEFFPNFDLSKLERQSKIDTGFRKKHEEEKREYQVLEVWSPETVAWKQGSNILNKTSNPYFDFKGEGGNKDAKKKKKNGEETELKFFNHLRKPTIPIVFFTPFTTGDAPVSNVSLAEVAIPIQDDINTQKRAIVNNLVRMGNGQVYIDKGALEQEMIDNITSEPGLIIVGDGAASENTVKREPGVALPSSHFQNLIDSTTSFDAIFGVQPAVRGASDAKTLGGQILNREQNLSRIDLLTRELNRGVAQIGNGLVQLMKMFYTESRMVRMIGTDDTVEFMRFIREDIEDNIVVNVKSGQTPNLDPVQIGNRAIQLWQLGAISPADLYRMLGMPNPEDLAERLLAWKTGQLLQETNARIAEAQAGAEAGQPSGEEERGLETNQNSRQRAESSINGTAPARLPNTPKTENT